MGVSSNIIILLLLSVAFGADVEFGGVFQKCESGECNTKCMSSNMWTGECSCPKEFETSCFSVLANGAGSGTEFCFCEAKEFRGVNYGGSYQMDGEGESLTCRVPNRYQGDCSCPNGYLESSSRVLVESRNTMSISRIVACVHPEKTAGNFRGFSQKIADIKCISENHLSGNCECPVNACPSFASATIDNGYESTLSVCTSSMQVDADPSTIQNKVLFGYQGWFATPADKQVGWFHWTRNGNMPPSGTNSEFDVWPDLSEFGADELYPTNLHYTGGKVAGLYTADTQQTVTRHFQWMQTYGLDGILLQRFVNEITNHADVHYTFRNNVTSQVISASKATGRVWAIEYDTSGADPNLIYDVLTNDWTYLVKTLGIVNSQYLHQDGKPVVALWGFGFTGNNNNQSSSLKIINWFKSQGAYVVGGVPYWWRTECCDSQPDFLSVYNAYDLISPWAVGRYGNPTDFQNLYKQAALPDVTYTTQNKLGYGPVIFPGFSWANMHGNFSIFNQIPRMGGTFFNAQANTWAQHQGVTFIKIAMFDEVDEGTAMFKAAATKVDTPTDGTFLYMGIDGTPMSNDAYLCLAGSLTAKNGG